jgi:Ca2+-binding RTX toxin-like protein
MIATAATAVLVSAGLVAVATPAQAIPVGCDEPGEVVFLGGGDDLHVGTPGADLIFGGEGNDTIYGNGGRDVLVGGPGYDILIGGECDDGLFGNNGGDSLGGRGGNDVMEGGQGDDQCSNNAWPDIIYFSNFLPC